MIRKLVAYFSASGVTAGVARLLSETIGAYLFAIEPEIPYTQAELDWMNKISRSTVEMNDQASRLAILESYELTGKAIVPFVTFSGSGMRKNDKLLPNCNGAVLIERKFLKTNANAEEFMNWVKSLKS